MQGTARLYHCCRCQAQVIICSRCDRGNRYCVDGCAEFARDASLKRAGHKYQSTRRGSRNNAARQKAFRVRQKQIVTHQGSQSLVSHDVLKTRRVWPKKPSHHGKNVTVLVCHHCGSGCSAFLRQDFYRRGRYLPFLRQPIFSAESTWQ